MHSSTFLKTALAAAIALTGQTNAQVTTSCDPTKGICPNDKGLAAPNYAIDFTSVKTLPSEWTLADSENITLGPQGAEFAFEKRYDSPTMWTDFKFFFGRIEFVVKAAAGTGIVSSMVLLSGDLDEIDWEFLGGVTSTIQTNYFGKGYTGTYNRSTTPAVTSPQTTFHTYAIDWSPTALVWSIDGAAVRILKAADADGNGSQYPQTPMKVSLSLWDAGDPDAATQGWGGGVTPIPPPEPYVMYVKSVKIWNTNPAQQYKYTDQSGSYNSIKLIQEPIVSSSSSQISSQSTKTLSLGSTSAPSSTVSASGSWSSGALPSGALPSGSYSTGNQSYMWNGPAHHTASSSDDQGSDSSSGCSTSEASSTTWASASGQSDSITQAYTSTIDVTITLPSANCSCTLKNGTTTTTASPTVWVTPTNKGNIYLRVWKLSIMDNILGNIHIRSYFNDELLENPNRSRKQACFGGQLNANRCFLNLVVISLLIMVFIVRPAICSDTARAHNLQLRFRIRQLLDIRKRLGFRQHLGQQLRKRKRDASTRVLSVISSAATDITISNTVTQGVGYWNYSTIASSDDQVPTQAASTSSYLPPPYPTTNPSPPILNPPLVSGSGAWVNGTIPFTGAGYKHSVSLKTILPIITITGSLFLFW
ncbi:MAG: hypothetical protein L6R37_006039 [Teloschistes peruensis]|nr:MAG: hypothetical protein L6R37_006039 [Teloschistes peruensis]